MTAAASLRVRRLDLRAPHRDAVLPFRNDLEDALRTATLPSLHGGATLHIRKLALGRLPTGLSRQALSDLVSRRLAEMPVVRLHWPAPEAPGDARAVVVPGPVEAAALALRAILEDRAMPWALAERFALTGSAAAPEAEAQVLQILTRDAGPAAPGRLCELPGGLPLMLGALDRLDAAQVRAFLAPALSALSPPRRASVQALIDAPVASAPRAGDALDENATRILLDTVFADAPPGLRALLADALPRWGRRAPRTWLAVVWTVTAQDGPASLPRRLRQMAMLAGMEIDAPKAPADDTPASPARKTIDDPAEARATRLRRPFEGVEPPPLPGPRPLEQVVEDLDLAGAADPLAGLWLLLPALRLVGAEAAEEALGLPLCRPLLLGFARRLGLRDTEPLNAVLTSLESAAAEHPGGTWRADESVLGLIAPRSGYGAARSVPGRAVLTQRGNRLPLAQIAAPDLAALRRTDLALHRAAPASADPAALQTGLTLAIQRLLRRLTGLGWRDLAARPGRVLITPTHVDVTFDGTDADPRIRIAGLDFDPGWVPWLGRVVSFHYDYSDPAPGPVT